MLIFCLWLAYHVKILLTSVYYIVRDRYRKRFRTKAWLKAKYIRDYGWSSSESEEVDDESEEEKAASDLEAVHAEAYENAIKN